jgi:hypothetical protein
MNVSVSFNEDGGVQAARVLQYGSPYLRAFERLARRGLTPVAAADKLQVNRNSAYRWERNLMGVQRSVKISAQTVGERREQWKIACAESAAEIGLMGVRRRHPSTYNFLVKNDGAWFREFSKSFVDARKSQLGQTDCQLLTAAKERLAARTPPVWMCRAAIWKEAGIEHRAPLGSSVGTDFLAQLVESRHAYRERVLEFWMKELASAKSLHFWSFLKHCHIAGVTLTNEQRMRIKSWLSSR